ncbi:MAG: sulfotransferase, partial [Pirellulales bacterium]
MNRPAEPGFAPALVIAGMHRSGTSLVAGSCQAAGLRLGDRLLGAYRGNEAGHFEDLDFVEWHQLVLRANGLAPEGFVTQATPPVPTALAQKAEALVAARRELGECWGWKDPRTTLHLEFWRHMVPEARFLFVVRRPWEVIDSLFRRGDEAFRLNPPSAIQVWLHYNRLVRDFAVKYPDRSLVCDLSQFVENPAAVFEAARRVLGVPLGEPPDRFRPELLGQRTEASRIAFLAATCPEAITLYAELAALAGSEPPRLDVGPGDRGVVTGHGFQEWSHCRHLGGRMQLLDQALTEADDANAGLTAELTAAREARATADQQNRDELATLHHGLDLARRQLADSEARQEQLTRTLAEQAEARAALESQVAGLEQRLATAVAER